jgi:hypothetical protein
MESYLHMCCEVYVMMKECQNGIQRAQRKSFLFCINQKFFFSLFKMTYERGAAAGRMMEHTFSAHLDHDSSIFR